MKKTIAVISGDRNGGIVALRGYQYFKQLKHKYDFIPLSPEQVDTADLMFWDAAVFFHVWHSDHLRMIERVKRVGRIPVVFDMDDLLTQMPSDHMMFAPMSEKSQHNVPAMIAMADRVVLSTDYLQRQWNHLNKNITVIENSIDWSRYENPPMKPYHTGFVVGWTGSLSHISEVHEILIPPLSKFMDRHHDVRAYFHLVCPQTMLDKYGSRIIFESQPVDWIDWPAMCATYPFDVCAVPLHKNAFNEAKSDLRLLDMAPFHIPLIASPRSQFKRHKDQGLLLLAETENEWLEAFEKAYADRQMLNTIADKAHRYVKAERSHVEGIEQWDSLLGSLWDNTL